MEPSVSITLTGIFKIQIIILFNILLTMYRFKTPTQTFILDYTLRKYDILALMVQFSE